MSMDFDEGYNDGIAGIGMQVRRRAFNYLAGFIRGSQDRKAMLAKAERASC
jgi:hypothetical protein